MITKEVLELKRMRLLCGLRQLDVWAGTGITPGRLSNAENGRAELQPVEISVLRSYLQDKWSLQQEFESQLYSRKARKERNASALLQEAHA